MQHPRVRGGPLCLSLLYGDIPSKEGSGGGQRLPMSQYNLEAEGPMLTQAWCLGHGPVGQPVGSDWPRCPSVGSHQCLMRGPFPRGWLGLRWAAAERGDVRWARAPGPSGPKGSWGPCSASSGLRETVSIPMFMCLTL